MGVAIIAMLAEARREQAEFAEGGVAPERLTLLLPHVHRSIWFKTLPGPLS